MTPEKIFEILFILVTGIAFGAGMMSLFYEKASKRKSEVDK